MREGAERRSAPPDESGLSRARSWLSFLAEPARSTSPCRPPAFSSSQVSARASAGRSPRRRSPPGIPWSARCGRRRTAQPSTPDRDRIEREVPDRPLQCRPQLPLL